MTRVVFGPGDSTWTCPDGVFAARVRCRAGGGGGAGGAGLAGTGGGGGGGGGYAELVAFATTPGQVYPLHAGSGGTGGIGAMAGATDGSAGDDSWFGDQGTCWASGGGGGTAGGGGGSAGLGLAGQVLFAGGRGGSNGPSAPAGGGGGGGGPGDSGSGQAGQDAPTASGGAGGGGGPGVDFPGGLGGDGANHGPDVNSGAGYAGGPAAGGGGGGPDAPGTSFPGGDGGGGMVVLDYPVGRVVVDVTEGDGRCCCSSSSGSGSEPVPTVPDACCPGGVPVSLLLIITANDASSQRCLGGATSVSVPLSYDTAGAWCGYAAGIGLPIDTDGQPVQFIFGHAQDCVPTCYGLQWKTVKNTGYGTCAPFDQALLEGACIPLVSCDPFDALGRFQDVFGVQWCAAGTDFTFEVIEAP